MHHDGGIEAHDVFMVLYHGFPPIGFDVVFQFGSVGSVIVYSAEPVVDFTGGEDEAVFFAVGNNVFEKVCGHGCVFDSKGAKIIKAKAQAQAEEMA